MKPGEGEPWVVDTSIIVHVLRGKALGRYIVEDLQLRARAEVPIISVVSIGELLSLAHQFGHGTDQRAYMAEILSELIVANINQQPILEAYADIDWWCRQNGKKLGKNDLWIATTAVVHNATLLTCDKDFDPLHGKFLTRIYLDPRGAYPPSQPPEP